MTARYGDRSRVTSPVGSWGKAGGAALGEVIITTSPAPASPSSPVTIAGNEFIIRHVNANTDLTVVSAPVSAYAEVLLVAGGGGGGGPAAAPFPSRAGGGGGGGVQSFTIPLTVGTYPIVIGGGGGITTNGSNSTGFGFTANGGGGGGPQNNVAGKAGGSGGGGGGNSQGGPNILDQGGRGRSAVSPFNTSGGGGGGAGGGPDSPIGSPLGNMAGTGGTGLRAWFLQGSSPPSFTYFGGGGGGGSPSGTHNAGGLGGGGRGGTPGGTSTAGSANTGGGGGGFNFGGGSQNGGSGKLVMRFRRFQP